MKKTIINLSLWVSLLLLCGFTALIGCNETVDPELSDKEMFITQLRRDFGAEDGNIEVTLNLFAQEKSISSAFPIDLKVTDGEIIIIKDVYDSVTEVDDFEAKFDEYAFESANKTVPEEKVSEIKDKIKNIESCYLLKCENGDDLPQIAIYIIDGSYYLLTLYPDDEHVMRIHWTEITNEGVY